MTDQTNKESVELAPPVPVNPLLDRLRLPGATFRLPSQGIFYTNGELDESVVNGELEVYPLTAIDEIVLSTPDKLLSGKAIEEVFAHCIPQILKPKEILAQDVDFLMLCLRLVSFGQTLDVTFRHDCENSKEHTYSVDMQALVRATKALDPTTLKADYETVLPNGQRVALRPLVYGGVVGLYETTLLVKRNQEQDEGMSEEEMQKIVVGTLATLVRSVDGVKDRQQIVEWLTKLPLGWKRQIEELAHNASKWGVDTKIQKRCKDCGEDFETNVTTNPVSFFT